MKKVFHSYNRSKHQPRNRMCSIKRALQILDWLANKESPASTYEIVKSLSAPLSSIYTLVNVLVSNRLLDRNDRGMIWLGEKLYRYGLTYARIYGPITKKRNCSISKQREKVFSPLSEYKTEKK